MLFNLPDHATLYRALTARDEQYEGRAYVAVITTGIFCRLSCPARKPKSENCQFYSSVGECIESGFRACKRCHPLGSATDADPIISTLLTALDKNPEYRWSELDIVKLGFDLSTVRRSFKRQLGITFLEIARQRRLKEAFDTLSSGGKVVEAQIGAGFESASAFRVAFSRLVGCSPGSLSRQGTLLADWIATPLGDMIAISDKDALHLLEFMDRKALGSEVEKLRKYVNGNLGIGCFEPTEQIRYELDGYFSGTSANFSTPIVLHGSEFARQVWAELRRIPAGVTKSYSDVARSIDRPASVRAVAKANGANQLALVIPCHRVIGADGSLTGYGGGLWRKQRLIEIEQSYAK